MSESPTAASHCSRCSAPLAPTASQGALCPRCLLAQALADSDADPALDTPAAPRAVAPAPGLEEIAPLFPELEIVELLGQGGMGSVYKARQRTLGRWVALKLLTPPAGDEQAFAARFEREAQALARLAHPHVVGIHDSGRSGGRCWLLMEYVEGSSLRELTAQGALELPQVLSLVRQICEALEYAHRQGVVHRDIKPENVLVDRQGRVKIADFGLAKLLGEAHEPAVLTRTRQSMGTPQYMAPEQLTGSRDVDARADLYSLGVVFYELLTGELPLGRFEPPSRRAALDPRYDEVVLRALEREPEKRYQHASELRLRLERLPRARRASEAATLAWLLGFWPAALVLALSARVLALPRREAELLSLGFGSLVLATLVACAWLWRHDRRGAALRAVLGSAACAGALAILAGDLLLPSTPLGASIASSAEPWVVRGLLALLAFEGWKLAQSGRAQLGASWMDLRPRAASDAALVFGTLASVLACVPRETRAHAPLLAALTVLLVDRPSWKRAPSERESVAAPERGLARRIGPPLVLAVLGWTLPLFTHGWGWFGPLASTLALALALAWHLRRSLPPALRVEQSRAAFASRAARSLAMFALFALGALGVGAALVEPTSLPAQAAAEPDAERLAELAAQVAGAAPADVAGLRQLSERIRGCRLVSRAQVGEEEPLEVERAPSAAYGLLLLLLAPPALFWSRRTAWSWNGCWRWACEGVLLAGLGLASSLPLGALLVARERDAALGEARLSVEAGLSQGIEATRAALERALEAEGYAPSGRTTRMLGDAQGWALAVDRLAAGARSRLGNLAVWTGPCGPREPELLIELAGDPAQRASAVRIEAPALAAARAGAWRARLQRLLERVRRD